MHPIDRRLTEWSRRAPSDIGREGRTAKRVGASESNAPYKIRSSCRAFVSNAFTNVDPWEKRARFADYVPIRQLPPLHIRE